MKRGFFSLWLRDGYLWIGGFWVLLVAFAAGALVC